MKQLTKTAGADYVQPFPADLPALTSIRFFLAAGVAFFHYHLHWDIADTNVTSLLERARLGVDVFFILSGFILIHVYHRQLEERRYNHRRFLLARFARIYPMHAAGLLLMLAMIGVAFAVGAEYDRAGYGWAAFLRAATLTQAWWIAPPINIWNGPSWSLSAELFAYLAFPVFAWVGLRLKSRPVILAASAVVLFIVFDLWYQAVFAKILPRAEEQLGILRIIPEFLYGVALYRLGERWRPSRQTILLAASASALLLLTLMHLAADDRLIVAAAGPLVLTLAMLSKGGDVGLLSRPSLLLLGEASYALYLLHMPILIGWRHAAVLTGVRSGSYAMAVWEVIIVFGVTVLAAVLAHLWWERPARDFIRRAPLGRSPSRQAPVPLGSQPPDA